MQKMMDMRDAYGETLAEIGVDPRVVVLDADLSHSNKSDIFGMKYPERFFEAGIAEANMVGVAAGLSLVGFIPFIHTFSVFAVGRVYDQIRVSICYQNANVKVVGTSAGLSDAHDGATHQSIDDVTLARVLPNMTVVVSCDCVEVRKATKAVYEHSGPVYLRIDRMPVPFVYESMENCEFKIGKANVLREGFDVTIIASGYPVALAVKAADQAQKEGISADVFDMHTVKPLDQKAIIASAKKTGAVVTVEEHSVIGALGGAVTEVLGEKFPVPIKRIGVKDRFGESALDWNELMSAHGITVEAIVDASRDILKRKTV